MARITPIKNIFILTFFNTLNLEKLILCSIFVTQTKRKVLTIKF